MTRNTHKIGSSSWGSIMGGRIIQIVSFVVAVSTLIFWDSERWLAIAIIVVGVAGMVWGWIKKESGVTIETDEDGKVKKKQL